MKIKLDENLPSGLASELRQEGHEADSVVEEGLTGKPDTDILAHVQAEERLLITLDKGIADVRAYPPGDYYGIVLLRPKSTGPGVTMEFARKHLPSVLQMDVAGHLFVITERGIRKR